MKRLTGKSILLVIGGGIAAYKALELIRRLKDSGAAVRAILTTGGAEFITPLSAASLTGEKVYTDLFSLKDETEMGHIRLSREADLIVVAPATANLIAKMAQGIADDLASATLLASDKPVMVAPAMNAEMWAKPATQRNLAILRGDGVYIIEPGAGVLACGEMGLGRLAEPEGIRDEIVRFFEAVKGPLAGITAIVTAGPTFEPIDPVRYLANRSSGKQGYAIARALAARAAETVLVSGPTALEAPEGVERIEVETAREMHDAVMKRLPADVAVMAAAVSDFRVKQAARRKIKKAKAPPSLVLEENPDILAAVAAAGNMRPRLVIGFAAETGNLVENARAKLAAKGCDWIVANDVSPASGAMGGEENAVTVITRGGAETWEKTSKQVIADRLADRIAGHLKAAGA